MSCERVRRSSCPCVLADIHQCSYCILAQGEEFCSCDWQETCAYDQGGKAPSLPPGNVIVAVKPYGPASAIVLKVKESLLGLRPGTALSLDAGLGERAQAILLRQYNRHNLLHLVSFTLFPFAQLRGYHLRIFQSGNVFCGAEFLAEAAGQSILLLANPVVLPLLEELHAGLKASGNRVHLTPLCSSPVLDNPDLVFIAGKEWEVKKAVMELPPSYNGKIVFWTL
ncbi:hypothetical protein [Acetonema longum]|uniref:Uncharacterized protein n=1 Tax=Acetonema longum DSM 6540 TaxID=1009370 RepID=F7NJ60_9FIRM|nr:hypothetical protein [Acetonema longum]EGO63950.1 hypothetical protein ALO_10579 [Acetonema longum DSM 6540]